MIGIDTNIPVRYIMADDEEQTRKAIHILETDISADNPGLIGQIVLAELVWILGRTYRLSRNDITAAIELLLRSEFLIVDHEEEVAEALALFREQRCDFSEALIGAIDRNAGCETTITFDVKASKCPTFTLR